MLADNNAALAALVTASIVVPLTILAIVVWFFQRSAKRFDEEQRLTRSQASDSLGESPENDPR